MPRKPFCTFHLDGHFFGIDLLQVQEILRRLDITHIPLAPPVIAGLVNLRGQIVTAINMRQRLELAPAPDNKQPTHVVVRTDEGAASLLVDEIGDMMELSDNAFEPTPDTIHERVRALISGVYKIEKKLLLVLDINKTVNMDLKALS